MRQIRITGCILRRLIASLNQKNIDKSLCPLFFCSSPCSPLSPSLSYTNKVHIHIPFVRYSIFFRPLALALTLSKRKRKSSTSKRRTAKQRVECHLSLFLSLSSKTERTSLTRQRPSGSHKYPHHLQSLRVQASLGQASRSSLTN